MSRLADRILASTDPGLAEIRKGLRDAPIIAADSVCEYFYTGTDQELWEIDKDFPNLAPPWGMFWIEARHPSAIVSAVHGRTEWSAQRPSSWGAMFLAFDLRDPATPRPFAPPEGARWLLMASPYWEFKAEGAIVPLMKCAFAVKDDGTSFSYDEWGPPVFTTDATLQRRYARALKDGGGQAYVESTMSSVDPLLLAISFMHCKNVHLRDVVPPEKLNKRRVERNGTPFVRYHELEIEPMRRVLATEGRSGEVGTKAALHICRGHFRDYRMNGLFGKHKGLFWFDQHVRGSTESGIVAKDYRIAAPAGPAARVAKAATDA
jgi:hypothetical protein